MNVMINYPIANYKYKQMEKKAKTEHKSINISALIKKINAKDFSETQRQASGGKWS